MLPDDANIPPGVDSVLVVDLDAVVANYRRIDALAATADVGVSIKADAYGLGAAEIAPVLAAAGCTTFFVATAAEGARLRPALADAEIVVLNGPDETALPLFARHRLTPALNSLGQLEIWRGAAADDSDYGAVYLHVDTGMSRLGLSPADVAALASDASRLSDVKVAVIMSHLACADAPASPMNGRQRDRLQAAAAALAPATGTPRISLANSAGVFLGGDYHFDLVRAGASIYGLNVLGQDLSKMAQVIYLYAKILQVRDIEKAATVGYGATHRAHRASRIATVATGYADGYVRAAGRLAARDTRKPATAYIGDAAAPLAGRVSMDLLSVDVSALPEGAARPGAFVELIGTHVSTDDLADVAGTIGYEVLTRLGPRHHRIYLGGATG